MATGWITVDGKAYFLKDNGVWDSKAAAKTAAAGSGPMVALTFDDGPGKYTERILDTLQDVYKRQFICSMENIEL